MYRGDLGLEQLRVGVFQVMPGVPAMLVVCYSCVGDARPLATWLLLPLVLLSDCSSAAWIIQIGKGGRSGGEAHACTTLRVHSV